MLGDSRSSDPTELRRDLAMVTILKGVFDHAPKEILRLITGGIFLGLVLLVFLKVVDSRFDLDPQHLDALGLAATPILGLLLCIDIVPFRKRVLKVFAASLVIFAIGFATNQVVADLKALVAPPAIPSLEEIEGDR
jgi:hypothetical protein